MGRVTSLPIKICWNPNPGTCEYSLIWKLGLCRCNWVKVRSYWVRVSPTLDVCIRRDLKTQRRLDREGQVKMEARMELCYCKPMIKPVHPKGNQPWIFTEKTDAGAKVPILWPPDVKSWLTGKDPDTGKDWGGKGVTKDEMVGPHHRLNGYEFVQALGDGEGQGILACCSPWGHKELETA